MFAIELAPSAVAQCVFDWATQFGVQGFDAAVAATIVYDDGTGPTVYAAGMFTHAGAAQVNRIAKWNGTGWSPLGDGLNAEVRCMAVYGNRLYVGGLFTMAGNQPANYIAQWDGISWSGIGGGTNFPVLAMHVPVIAPEFGQIALYAGGQFTSAGVVTANHIAGWNGTSWFALGTAANNGVNSTVQAIDLYNNGSARLIVGGFFTTAGGQPANYIAQWNGMLWSPMHDGFNGRVSCLRNFVVSGVNDFFAGGVFTQADGQPAPHIARWDGSAWHPVDLGTNGEVRCMLVFAEGGEFSLYAGGDFSLAGGQVAGRLARWDRSAWHAVSTLNGSPLSMTSFDDDGPFQPHLPALFIGGSFPTVGANVPSSRIAKWQAVAPVVTEQPTSKSAAVGRSALFGVEVASEGTPTYRWKKNGAYVNDGGNVSGAQSATLTISPVASTDAGEYRCEVTNNCGLAESASATLSVTTAVCELAWDRPFRPPGIVSLNCGVHGGVSYFDDNGFIGDTIVFDDGSGPALYVTGSFCAIDGEPAHEIARWDGAHWTGFPEIRQWTGRAFAVFDDGSGPALYAVGLFVLSDSTRANVVRWNGATWLPIPGEVHYECLYEPLGAAVFDDGSGEALYISGCFSSIAGVPAANVARWNGRNWSAVSSGIPGNIVVGSLFVFNDGTGPALYAAGDYTYSERVMRWSGSTWSNISAGLTGGYFQGPFGAYAGPNGTALFISDWDPYDYAPDDIARWNGSQWAPMGVNLQPPRSLCAALGEYDDGTGNQLYTGGTFSNIAGLNAHNVARWNGTAWSTVGTGLSLDVSALTSGFVAGHNALYAAGSNSGSPSANDGAGIASWNGAKWFPVGAGAALSNVPFALAEVDVGAGPRLYAAGIFDSAGMAGINGIAAWDDDRWAPVGSGVGFDQPALRYAIAAHMDASGTGLFVGGEFTSVDSFPANRIAKWDGSAWSRLDTGMNGGVYALKSFGGALYAGGAFTTAGTASASHVARWTGSTWQTVAGGVDALVLALVVYDDGTGPALYAAGDFTHAGGIGCNRIAKLNGSQWQNLGTGLNGSVAALAVYDDGTGPALYAGGSFTMAGTTPVNGIARWRNGTWSALGEGFNDDVSALTVFDDTGGPGLYAGGFFTYAGTTPAHGVARWDGATWQPVAGGVNVGTFGPPFVSALATFDPDGPGPKSRQLFVGGEFQFANGDATTGIPSRFIAAWGPTRPTIVTPPTPQRVPTGMTTVFSVVAGGGQSLTFRWQKNGSDVSNGGRVSGATTDTLTIANTQPADQGSYRVVVTSSCGVATSNYVYLFVDPALCPGDLTGDRQVGLSDLTQLLSHFGTNGGATLADGDLNGDGRVDLNDLTTLLSAFGSTCP